MKGDRLGEFEELTLLAVRAIKGEAYGGAATPETTVEGTTTETTSG